jgi:hypothetical protein
VISAILLSAVMSVQVEKISTDELMAAVLIGEAGIEKDDRAFWAIKEVVLNRAELHHRRIWTELMQPNQFSCLNRVRDLVAFIKRKQECPRWKNALRVAKSTLRTDYTHGATHYHERRLHPKWSMYELPLVEIGHHKFFRVL